MMKQYLQLIGARHVHCSACGKALWTATTQHYSTLIKLQNVVSTVAMCDPSATLVMEDVKPGIDQRGDRVSIRREFLRQHNTGPYGLLPSIRRLACSAWNANGGWKSQRSSLYAILHFLAQKVGLY